MLIDISQLKEDGFLLIDHVYDPSALGLENEHVKYKSPLSFKGRLDKISSEIIIKGSLTCQVELTCARCLKVVSCGFKESVEQELEYSGQDSIDITNDICEVMILSYPLRSVCSENCKGLCFQCGTNLNEGKCDCQDKKEIKNNDNPFSKLADWHKSKK